MKILSNSVFRAICAVAIGALLIEYREQTVTWLIIIVGVLFFLAGVVSIAVYLSDRNAAAKVVVGEESSPEVTAVKPSFPVVGVGSVVLGVILATMPTVFSNFIVYILAAMLILGAISQYMSLAAVRKIAHIGAFFWIMPSLILLVSLYLIVYPQEAIATSQLILGWCIVVYGIVECVNAIKIAMLKRMLVKQLRQANAETESQAEPQVVDAEAVEATEEKAEAKAESVEPKEEGGDE